MRSENIVVQLLQNADHDIERAQRGIIYIDEVDKSYDPIPDASWIDFEMSEIIVQGGENGAVGITIEIPPEDEYYNQSYWFWIIADQTGGGGNIQTDYKCRWMVITPTEYVSPELRPGYEAPFELPWMYIGAIGVIIAIVAIALVGRRKKGPKQPTGGKKKDDDSSYKEIFNVE